MFVNDEFASPEGDEFWVDDDDDDDDEGGEGEGEGEGGEGHYDLRDSFCRALWDHAEGLRRFEFDQRARVGAVTALVRMATHPEPVRNAAQAREVSRVGDRLAEVLQEVGYSATEKGKFATAAVAMLSVLVDRRGELVSMGDLIRDAGRRLERGRRFRSLETVKTQPGSCVAWAQMTPLIDSLDLVKRRQRTKFQGGFAFELTEKGKRDAPGLVRRRGAAKPDRGALRAWKNSCSDFFVAVDDREGGGDVHWLGNLCRRLRVEKVPHETRALDVGDYLFVRKVDGRYCGSVVERKTAVDLADSHRDGRWTRQYDNMKRMLRDSANAVSRIVYLVEGRPEDHVHTACGCGCFGVGACGNPTASELRASLASRRREPNVQVVEVKDERETARWLGDRLDAVAGEFAIAAQNTPTKRPAWHHQDDDDDDFHAEEDDQAEEQQAEQQQQQQQQQQRKKKKKACVEASGLKVAARAWERKDSKALLKFTLPVLKTLCQATGVTQSGNKKDVVARLLEPPEPQLLARRKRDEFYVPRDRTCAHAILCAMERSERRGKEGGLDKDGVMALAERTGVCEKSIYEKVGPMGYDGWSCAKDLVSKGEPPLCKKKKGLYTLTTYAGDSGSKKVSDSGRHVATALHFKAHQRQWCACGDPPPDSDVTRLTTFHDICGDDPDPDDDDDPPRSPTDIRSRFQRQRAKEKKTTNGPKTPPTATAVRRRPRDEPPPLTGDAEFDSLWDRDAPTTPLRRQPIPSADDDDDSIVDLTTDSPLRAFPQCPADQDDDDKGDDDDDSSIVDLTGDSP